MKALYPLVLAALVGVASPAIAQQPKVQTAESVASAPGRGEAVRTCASRPPSPPSTRPRAR